MAGKLTRRSSGKLRLRLFKKFVTNTVAICLSVGSTLFITLNQKTANALPISIDFGPDFGAPIGNIELSTQLDAFGVRFSSTSPNGVVWNGTNAQFRSFDHNFDAGLTTSGFGDTSPIRIDFVNPITGLATKASNVSIRAFDGGGDLDVLTLTGFDSNNTKVSSVTEGPLSFLGGETAGGLTLSLTDKSVSYILLETTNTNSGLFFDDLSYELDFSFSEVVADSVELSPGGNFMFATFSPNFGFTLNEAAILGGFDHFNWFQVVLEYPGFLIDHAGLPVFAPFVDPPPGGFINQPADYLPFYWDEGDDPRLDPELLLESNISLDRILEFSDFPGNTFVIPSINHMSFITTLVGVLPDGSWMSFDSFSWESDYNPIFDTGGLGLSRNIEPFPPDAGTGGIKDVQRLMPSEIPPEVVQIWSDSGWIGHGLVTVVEPSTLQIFLATLLLFVVLVILTRRHKKTGKKASPVQ